MNIAWYIVPYKLNMTDIFMGNPSRYVAINDDLKTIAGEPDHWREIETIGNRALVKVKASDAVLATLNNKYLRLPKDKIDDSLSSLSNNAITKIKEELLDMGYTIAQIKAKFGNAVNLKAFTLRDVFNFITKGSKSMPLDSLDSLIK